MDMPEPDLACGRIHREPYPGVERPSRRTYQIAARASSPKPS
jgi:hypothetical protein